MSLSSPMIRFANLQKTYLSEQGLVTALHPINLDIASHEIFGIIGHSGAGKSTLLRIINRLEQPTSGQIFIQDQEVTSLSTGQLTQLRRSIGIIFQHFNLLSSYTVAGNVAFPLRLAGLSRAQIDERVSSLLDSVGLTEVADRYPAQLSGGQKQRVGIARALTTQPSILLCDEATSALDPQTTESILQLLAKINRDYRITIVLITHEMDVIRRICDRVAVMDGGRIVELGDVAEVFLHPKHVTTRQFISETEATIATEYNGDLSTVHGRILRLTFLGDLIQQPLLSRISRNNSIDCAILSGRIDKIKGVPYGQLVVSLTGNDPSAAQAAFISAGITVEELRS